VIGARAALRVENGDAEASSRPSFELAKARVGIGETPACRTRSAPERSGEDRRAQDYGSSIH